MTGSGEDRVMVGMARVITDRVTFGYLTDVYVLPDHQGKGLGRWLMGCLDEVIREWRALRGFWLLSGDPRATRLYGETLATRPIGSCRVASTDLEVLATFGPGFQGRH